MSPILEALRHRTVLAVVGAGGVGKTTVSAALGLAAALDGRSAMVCTIDPAKRLANALGLSALGNEEARISRDRFEAAGLSPRAPLYAMMLDMKRAWDELIEARAPPDKRDRIFSSRFYKSLSTALAGSQEYIAMEKLWQLRTSRDYELIVLDTPPTVHAVDFLEAPDRVLDFLDNEAARWLLSPALAAGRFSLRLFNLGSSYIARSLSKLTGTETLQELAEFMLAIGDLNEGFRERARQTREMLAASTTAFVLVTTPAKEGLEETIAFHERLVRNGLRVAAIVVNRVHPPVSPADRQLCEALHPTLRTKLELTLDELTALAARDEAGLAVLKERCSPTPLVVLPRFPLDVYDLPSLHETGRYLTGELEVPLFLAHERASRAQGV